jgi:4-hydroxybenzoyl-CoA reductase subunit alpha
MRPEDLRDRQAADALSDAERREAVEREFTLIGRRLGRTDGLAKSTGAAVYTDDLVLPGMLHGKILRSPHPHARIVSIDTSGAESLEGVHAVVAGPALPGP